MNLIKIILVFFIVASSFFGIFHFTLLQPEKVVIEINSNTPAFDTIITPKSNKVIRLKNEVSGTFNDTIIVGGRKNGDLTWNTSGESEFYGHPPLRLQYHPYKATEVDLTFTFWFYDY